MIATKHKTIDIEDHILHAVIGVWYKKNQTFYVKRSQSMQNYPGAWSLFSIQYNPDELPDSLNLDRVQQIMDRMSDLRLASTPITVKRFLTATTCTNNPINKVVNMRLYSVEFENEPTLNPDYYVDAAWMNAEEYLKRRGNALCGSCIRMWEDYYKKRKLSNNVPID